MGQRAPGPKTPERYETTGPNYDKWGEQPGYTYDPTTDRYKANQAPAGQPQRPQGKTNAAGLLKLGKHALDASGVTEAATSIPAGFTVAADGMTLVNPVTGAVQVGTAEGGGALMSDGTIVGAASEGGMFSLSGIGSAGNGILPAAGAVAAYDLINRDFKKNGAGWARGGLQGAASGAAMGSFFGPPAALVGGIGGGLLGLAKVGFGHKSTKDYQNERWGALDPVSQSFRQANHPENDDHIWDSGKYAGQEWSWDKALDLAKEDPSQFAWVLGNFEAGGAEWEQIPADKRDNIIRRNIEEGNYYSNKGDIILHDKDRFRQIRDEELGIKPEDEEDDRGEGPAPLDNPIV